MGAALTTAPLLQRLGLRRRTLRERVCEEVVAECFAGAYLDQPPAVGEILSLLLTITAADPNELVEVAPRCMLVSKTGN